MTAMLKTCLSPTDGTRTKTLPSGYEMSRQVINYELLVRIDETAKGLEIGSAPYALAVCGSRSSAGVERGYSP